MPTSRRMGCGRHRNIRSIAFGIFFEDRMLEVGIDYRIRKDLMGHRMNGERYGAGATPAQAAALLKPISFWPGAIARALSSAELCACISSKSRSNRSKIGKKAGSSDAGIATFSNTLLIRSSVTNFRHSNRLRFRRGSDIRGEVSKLDAAVCIEHGCCWRKPVNILCRFLPETNRIRLPSGVGGGVLRHIGLLIRCSSGQDGHRPHRSSRP